MQGFGESIKNGGNAAWHSAGKGDGAVRTEIWRMCMAKCTGGMLEGCCTGNGRRLIEKERNYSGMEGIEFEKGYSSVKQLWGVYYIYFL